MKLQSTPAHQLLPVQPTAVVHNRMRWSMLFTLLSNYLPHNCKIQNFFISFFSFLYFVRLTVYFTPQIYSLELMNSAVPCHIIVIVDGIDCELKKITRFFVLSTFHTPLLLLLFYLHFAVCFCRSRCYCCCCFGLFILLLPAVIDTSH